MSTRCTPGSGLVMATGVIVSVTRIGGIKGAARRPLGAATSCAGGQAASSNPGSLQPGISLPASYSSPS